MQMVMAPVVSTDRDNNFLPSRDRDLVHDFAVLSYDWFREWDHVVLGGISEEIVSNRVEAKRFLSSDVHGQRHFTRLKRIYLDCRHRELHTIKILRSELAISPSDDSRSYRSNLVTNAGLVVRALRQLVEHPSECVACRLMTSGREVVHLGDYLLVSQSDFVVLREICLFW